MCLLASCGFLGLAVSGCVATDTIDFEPTENFPPSIISQPEALFPLDEIGLVNVDDPPPEQGAEILLQTTVRDPNLENTLQFRLFLNDADTTTDEGEIEPSGFVERDRDFAVPFAQLLANQCNKIDIVVTTEFASTAFDTRQPLIPGDFDQAVWWVRVTDSSAPVPPECP
ncbi:MAG: hypothetical protein AAGF92_23475 [Myxococcota bacterium]